LSTALLEYREILGEERAIGVASIGSFGEAGANAALLISQAYP
jgi:hypothetical protein